MTSTLSRVVVEAYCYECDHVWNYKNSSQPGTSGRLHAFQTGHWVRVSTSVSELYNVPKESEEVKDE